MWGWFRLLCVFCHSTHNAHKWDLNWPGPIKGLRGEAARCKLWPLSNHCGLGSPREIRSLGKLLSMKSKGWKKDKRLIFNVVFIALLKSIWHVFLMQTPPYSIKFDYMSVSWRFYPKRLKISAFNMRGHLGFSILPKDTLAWARIWAAVLLVGGRSLYLSATVESFYVEPVECWPSSVISAGNYVTMCHTTKSQIAAFPFSSF